MALQVASLMASIGADVKGFEQGAAKVKGGLGSMASEFKSVLPPAAAQFLTVAGAVTAVAVAIKDAMDETTKYVNEVSQLARISNTSLEDTSRFVQVLDDYKISADDALVATRKLTQQGYTPSIDTLATLSDKYLSLNTAQEKNKFVLDNLGRSGLQWIEVLQKGSKSIREQGAAVEDNLLVTQKMRDDVKLNEIAWDNFNDSILGVKISLGNGLLPVVTNTINALMDLDRAHQILYDSGQNWTLATSAQLDVAMKQAVAEREASTALKMNSHALDDNARSAEDDAAALKALSDINRGMLSTIDDMQSAKEAFGNTENKLRADLVNNEKSYREALEQNNIAIRNNAEERLNIDKDDAEALQKNSEQAQAIAADRQKIESDNLYAIQLNSDAVKANNEEYKKANLEIISGLVERKLMQDGVLDDNEFNWLIKKREEWGLYSADVVAQAQAAWQEADKITASVANIPTEHTTVIRVVPSVDNVTAGATVGGASVGGSSGSSGANSSLGGGLWTTNAVPNDQLFSQSNASGITLDSLFGHASGGSFMIPSSYGNEGFRMGNGDTASGGEMVTITPRGGAPGGPGFDQQGFARIISTALRDTLQGMGVFAK